MNTSYYLRNNPAIVMGVVETALQDDGHTDIGRLAVLLPLIMDEKIVDLLIKRNVEYSFRQLVQSNNMFLANYNDRYLSLLQPLYHAVSIMLDAGQIVLKDKAIERTESSPMQMPENAGSQRLIKAGIATRRLLRMSQKESTRELYKLLKVEV